MYKEPQKREIMSSLENSGFQPTSAKAYSLCETPTPNLFWKFETTPLSLTIWKSSMKRYSFFCLFRRYCIFNSPIFFSTLLPPTCSLKLVSVTAVEHVCTYITRMQSIESFCLSPMCDMLVRKFDVQTSYIYIWTLQLCFRANICCAHQKSSGNPSHDCAFEELYCLNNA